MARKNLSFGSGIAFVLQSISIDSLDRQTFKEDAQIIENTLIKAISCRDENFRRAFGGLTLTGSNLDNTKINLPDEFDMLTKNKLPCIVKPVAVKKHSAFIFLRLSGPNVPEYLIEMHGGRKFLSRPKLHSWYRQNIAAVIPELNNIQCGNHRAYELKYIAHGYGVAHTLVATCRRDRGRKIYFDFVPAFEFQANEWPKNVPRRRNVNGSWYAVPRKFTNRHASDDTRSFMICAPYWELMVMKKKANLKDSMRLMKGLRNTNHMGRLISYMIKSAYMNATKVRSINWNQSPGKILIRMIGYMGMFLRQGFLPFYLVPEHNVFDTLSYDERHELKRTCKRMFRKLVKCRDNDTLTPKDMELIFGVTY